jgi:glycosyltransferase involved in cell wall biosynthesis
MSTIIQVLPSMISGGVEVGTIEIARSLVENGYGSVVVSNGGSMVADLEKTSTRHIQLNVQSKNPVHIISNIAKIAQIIKENNAGIVHARSRAPAWSCYYAARSSGASFITTVHGIYSANNFFKRLYNSVMTKGDRVIAVSNFVKRYLLENYVVDESKIRVIPRGVDHKYYDPSRVSDAKLAKFRSKYNVPEGVPLILLPARFTNWKGQRLLVEAINKIRHLNFYCVMVGDLAKHPDYVMRVKDMIVSKKLQGKVQIFGSENDMFNLYAVADIVLSTSIEPEAFGRIIIEAQSMQKLVIASDIGGASETIRDGVSGLHFNSSDANDLAEKIQYALDIFGQQEYMSLCSEARNSAIKNYSLQTMQEKTLAVYKELT